MKLCTEVAAGPLLMSLRERLPLEALAVYK